MVFAVTDPAAGKKGISAFLVPTDAPGYSVDKVEHKLGQAASDTCALRFEDMIVGDRALLGPQGDGYRIALSNLEADRSGIAAQSVGMAQGALEIAIVYVKDRRSMGRSAKIYRDVRVCQSYEGTSDIQRMLIARSL